ncbi:DUF6456 domain-containing protein [Sphingopyxis sp. BSN-002]|uniref:DUF6456 domain-containing protein n=1 Tax=Sphingopyxis sp. BSN-002 TaxID=2911495 RepID=UPI001EDA14D8|nr:DUF6456 domain-containing protein [Sphingopyxis sp. BSN-002]UKK85435.1 DUF6456 domain-containing protein [Sphingopyxis sp. BSN-002]
MTARRLETHIHPDDRLDPGKAGPQVMRRVTVNVAESPIAWLASRGMLTEAQLRAGERLRADYERAGLSARVTMRWDAAPPARSRGGARASDASLARMDAHRRFHAAVDHTGPGLADICWRVVCAGEAIGAAEKAMRWPARSGKLVLGLALDRLAQFYGIS